MSIEVMKQALEAMGLMGADLICEAAHHGKKDRHGIGEPCHIQQRWHKAFDALRTAIAEAEKSNIKQVIHLYDEPPAAQRQWVGLTEAEINEWDYDTRDVVMDIEKLLREKNHG